MNPASNNRTAFVTGGSRGIGRAVAHQLVAASFQTVIVNYLENDAEAEKTKVAIEQHGVHCVLARANLVYPEEIDRMFEEIRRHVTTIDVVVHCAALNAFKPLMSIKPNQWDMTMNINARSFLLCVQQVAPMMQGGSIIAISSLGSSRAIPNYGALGPTKAALEAIVRQLAMELAPNGIRVNAVTGGLVDTRSIQKFPDAAKLIDDCIERTPLKRIATPEDIALVVSFLAGPASRWITGQTLIADGGLTIV